MLPNGAGIYCYAFIHYFCVVFLLLLSIPFFILFKNAEWSMIPACPSLMCFFNRGDTEGTNPSKMLCLIFVYVLFYVNLCQH